jgi:alpha-tubulin suppressor-like RCC1 family protein
VAGLTNIQEVAAGGVHSMALTSSGSIYLWGDNVNGQVRDGATTDPKTPVLLSLSKVTAIAAGEFHWLALTSNGRST